ncbi:MAG: tetratricopeptide repeat protein [Burkholderiaceae bacterium]
MAIATYAQQVSESEPATIMQAPETAGILKIYYDGNYSAAAKLGSTRLVAEPANHELRLAVANSYAWTGRPQEAATHYQALAGTSYASKANLGLANVYRWDGLHGLAEPLYRQVLAAEPGDKDAIEGLMYSMRVLRPRTQARTVWASDSNDTIRNGVTVAQRWTDPSKRHMFEVELGALRDKRNDLRVNQRDLTFSYAGIAQPLKPRFEISGQQAPHNALFASGEVGLPNMPVTIGAGHINWGKMAFDPNALRDNLWANRISIHANVPSGIGFWNMNYYASRISDSNVVQDANMKFTPAWQPINIPEIKIFAGFEGRKARFNVPSYWSPKDGSYLGTIGVNAEWQDALWEKYILLQYGVPLGGEAQVSYSGNAGFKRWIGKNFAIVFNVAAQKSQRSGSYHASSAMIGVERLW